MQTNKEVRIMMFKELLNFERLTSSQIKKIEQLDKKFSATNAKHLEMANNLLFSLLYDDNLPALEKLLAFMTQIPFNKNFNLWSFIEPSYTLQYFLTDDDDKKTKITQYLTTEVRSEWDDDDEHAEFLQRKLDGSLVQSSLEKLECHKTSEKDEFIWRTAVLIRYLEVLALGASGKLDKTSVLNEIHHHIERQRFLNAKFNH